jgi:hypothetical protein
MSTSVIPALIDALVEQAGQSLEAVLVFDGMRVTSDPGDYLMVGVDDPDADGFAQAADADQAWAGLGAHAKNQTGGVWCVAESRNGDGDPKAARDAAYATVAAVEDLCRVDPTLAVLTGGWASVGGDERLSQSRVGGASARVAFRVNFQARI